MLGMPTVSQAVKITWASRMRNQVNHTTSKGFSMIRTLPKMMICGNTAGGSVIFLSDSVWVSDELEELTHDISMHFLISNSLTSPTGRSSQAVTLKSFERPVSV